MTSKTETTGGVSAISLLGIAFIVLKLCGVIDWSWWWVTAPFWMPITLLLMVLITGLVAVLLGWIFVFVIAKLTGKSW